MAMLAFPVAVHAQDVKAEEPRTVISGPGEQKPTDPPKVAKRQKLDPAKRQQAMDLLKLKKDEMKDLQTKATNVTLEMGKLASTGALAKDLQAQMTMQQMLDELKAIRERLEKMETEIEGIHGWIEGQNEALPIMALDIQTLKAHKESNYLQFQYQDTDQIGGQTDAFRLRRVRLGFTDTIAPNANYKISFDLATGTNQLNAQLKDAFINYDFVPSDVTVGTSGRFGQQPMPLGYELERSSSEREFPERARYNQVMFNGERNRGVLLTHGLGNNALVQVGGFNSMTVNDPEQANLAPAPYSKLGATAGIRTYGKKYDVGLSGYWATRPPFTSGTPAVTSPEVKREFFYLDGQFVGLGDPKLFLRGEVMSGKDRVPSATAGAGKTGHSMSGWHAILGYNVNYRNQFALKYEAFDPNKDAQNDLFTGWGIAHIYYFNPNMKLTTAFEWFSDEARAAAPISQKNYHNLTVRMQVKF